MICNIYVILFIIAEEAVAEALRRRVAAFAAEAWPNLIKLYCTNNNKHSNNDNCYYDSYC